MASYLHPGVYIEEIPSGAKPIEGVSTSVAAFVGVAHRGPAGAATLVGKFDDYVKQFGGIAGEDDAMGLAVQAFYLNGGGAAYICRLAGEGSSASSTAVSGEGAAGPGDTANPVLTLSASSVGAWGDDVYVRIVKPDVNALSFTLEVGHREEGEFVVDEIFADLVMVEGESNYAPSRVNGNSSLIEVSLGAAADIADAAEEYQAAVLTGGAIPSTPTHLSAGLAAPHVLTLNINGKGAEQITVDASTFAVALTGADVDADAASLATEITALVAAIGTDDAYQNFVCSYTPGTNRFAMISAEDGSRASVEVYDGALAELMGLDSAATATLTGTALGSGATVFSSAWGGLADTDLTLTVDGIGPVTITLGLTAAELVGANATDGATIALAIQNAVRAASPAIASFKDFRCQYSAAREFVLSSGSSAVRVSGLTLGATALATLLNLDAAALVPGRQREQGSAPVIPLQTLGTLAQGVRLTGGSAPAPTALDYGSFYNTVLRKVRDVSIMLLPGQPWPSSGPHAVIDATLAHCEAMGNRMLLIDPPAGLELETAGAVTQLGLPTSTYTAMYYPWVDVANPFYNVDTNPNASTTLRIAPSAFAAGQWARTDGRRGVWKAPAGVEAQLNGAAGLAFNVEELEQDQLNPLGINCYRKLPGYGSVIWGSRTLATKAKPEWRYVPVRRTAIFIEQSIYNGIQWAVFEPNDHPLWGSLRGNIGSFMNGLFRAGAFQGATAKEAYFVRCGLGDTMTQGDIDRGQVIVVVGFAPLKPAEFVIVRIQQKVGQQ